jgi:hypothetical protein
VVVELKAILPRCGAAFIFENEPKVPDPMCLLSAREADDRVKATNLALLATDRDTERAEALVNEMIGGAQTRGAALTRH